MRTIIIKSLLCLALLPAFIGASNAVAAPPTNLVGSWLCKAGDIPVFLVNFNPGGNLSGIDALPFDESEGPPARGYYGTWRRTGLTTFESEDLAFLYSPPYREYVQRTETIMEMSDNDHFTATATIDGGEPGDPISCTRTRFDD